MSDNIPGVSAAREPDPLILALLAAARIGLEAESPLWIARDLVTSEALAQGEEPGEVAGEALRVLRGRYDALRVDEAGDQALPPPERERTPGAAEGAEE